MKEEDKEALEKRQEMKNKETEDPCTQTHKQIDRFSGEPIIVTNGDEPGKSLPKESDV